MISHAPKDYQCPFCLVAQGQEDGRVLTRQSDIVYRGDDTLAFICSHQFPGNRGHTLVVPATHYENLYELPDVLGHAVHTVARKVALAMKQAYGCDGVTTWQSNEPAGSQTVWHYHLHVIPRFTGDDYLHNLGDIAGTYRLMAPELRAEYARKLEAQLQDQTGSTEQA